jgi:hypothetical protein
MSKKAYGCNCIQQVNKILAQHNTVLATELAFNFKTGKSRVVLPLPTCKIDTKIRGQAKRVFAAYCPVCGKKLEKPEKRKAATP